MNMLGLVIVRHHRK